MKGLERSGRVLACVATLVLAGVTLGGCSLFDKDVVLPEEPADKLYNEGLYLLNKKKDSRMPPRNSKRSTASTPIRNGRARR